jgi:type IV pilus assembly protein PilM
MSESIWKKEISFKRKPKAEAPAPPPAPAVPAKSENSIWKKEIGFSRKPKTEAPAPAPVVPEPKAVEEKTSIWKKEIGFSRKRPEAAPVAPAPTSEPPRAVVLAPQPVPGVAPEPEVVQPQAVVVSSLAPVPAAQVAPEPQAAPPSVDAAPLVVAPEPVAEPWYATAALPPAPEQEPVAVAEVEPEPAAEPWYATAAVPPAPEQEPVEVADVEPEPAVEPWQEPALALTEEPRAWTELVDVSDEPDPAVPMSVQPAYSTAEVWTPEPAPQVPLAEPEPAAQWAVTPEPALEVPLAEAPPEVEPVTVTREPATQTEVEPTPFWKKELSFKRKPKAAKPEQAPPAQKRRRGLGSPKPSRGGHKATRVVGLKIGASQVAAAHVSNNGAAELLQVAREPLEQGIVVAGELRDPDALAAALKRFFARNKLPRKNVRLGIATNRIGVRIFDLGGIEDEKQLANAIRFRAQEALPIPLDEAVLDYRVLSEHVDDVGASTRRVLLVVAYRELVDRYVAACKKAGITVSGVDLEAFALLRSLAPPPPEDELPQSALVAVAIGHDRSTFAVSDGRVCEFTRVLEWGGGTLNVALARALDLAPSEVETLKHELSLDSNEPPEGMDPHQHALALDALRRQVQSFARELVSSLQFYQHQAGSLSIGEIVLTGGSSSLNGLPAELQRLTGVRVRVGDPLARMKVAKRVRTEEPMGSLAVAIGLGIDD